MDGNRLERLTRPTAVVLWLVGNGSEKNPKMKAYKEIFTPTEIASLVPYIRNLKEK